MSAIAGAVSKVGSMFGLGGGKRTSGGIAREQLRMQNRAIRERPEQIRTGAERGGFNPLTYMMASGGGGNVGSFATGATPSAPPLASFGAVMSDLGDFFQRQQTIDQNERALRSSVEADLAYIEAERRRAGGAGEVVSTTLRAPRVQQVTASPVSTNSPDEGETYAPYDADRVEEKLDAANGPGITRIENDYLPDGGIILPGADGEPWGADEVLTGVVVGAPQILYKWGGKLGNKLDDWRHARQFDRLHKQQETSEGREPEDIMRATPAPGWMDRKYGPSHVK